MIYLDNAATTFPKPKIVYEKMMEALTEYGANPGRSGHDLSMRMNREIFMARMAVTRFIGGDNPMNLIFTLNCTDSLNMAIMGLVEKGDHVITTAIEHNSVLRPLKTLEKEGIIELTIVKATREGIVDPKKIEEAIKSNTRICVTTMMSNLIGTIIDFKEIGRILKEKNIYYILDAAQGLGYLPISMKEDPIDILCFPGHKGLYGPMGTGGMYINGDIPLRPFRVGGTGSFSMELYQPEVLPDKFESGTENGPGIIGLGAGVEFIEEIGIEKVRDHEEELTHFFIDRLEEIDKVVVYGTKDKTHGPVVAMNIKGKDSSEVADRLNDEGIAVRAGFHCAPLSHKTIGTEKLGAVRFSIGYFNTKEDIEYAIATVEKIAKEG